MPRRSASDVARTREAVTRRALRQASLDGLEGLTIGRLAEDAGLSKSGLFGLFGSREELQLATLEAAVAQFTRDVWLPVADAEPGRARLAAVVDAWIGYHERDALPGGCFFTTTMAEWDARPGPLRDAVAGHVRRWLGVLEHDARIAVERGELPGETDPVDVAFSLNALASAGSLGHHLHRDASLARARRLMLRTIGAR